MLAAHRCGGRTSFISFARAWDRFARAKRARTATERELSALEAHLTASILAERGDADLGGAIADHQTLVRERKAGEAARLGLGWLRRRDGARDEELVKSRAARCARIYPRRRRMWRGVHELCLDSGRVHRPLPLLSSCCSRPGR